MYALEAYLNANTTIKNKEKNVHVGLQFFSLFKKSFNQLKIPFSLCDHDICNHYLQH